MSPPRGAQGARTARPVPQTCRQPSGSSWTSTLDVDQRVGEVERRDRSARRGPAGRDPQEAGSPQHPTRHRPGARATRRHRPRTSSPRGRSQRSYAMPHARPMAPTRSTSGPTSADSTSPTSAPTMATRVARRRADLARRQRLAGASTSIVLGRSARSLVAPIDDWKPSIAAASSATSWALPPARLGECHGHEAHQNGRERMDDAQRPRRVPARRDGRERVQRRVDGTFRAPEAPVRCRPAPRTTPTRYAMRRSRASGVSARRPGTR